MNILYFSWDENSENDMLESLKCLDIEVTHVKGIVIDFLVNEKLSKKLSDILEEKEYEAIITFDYFPFISKLAEKKKVKYASWIYDCPHLTLNSLTVINESNYFFVFDKLQLAKLINSGAKHAYYLPLAVNTKRISKMFDAENSQYENDISFVGSLYEKNNYSKIKWNSDYVKGYLNGLINAQRQVYGCNIIENSVTNLVMDEIEKTICLNNEPECPINKKEFIIDEMLQKVTSDERILLLNMLAVMYKLGLYTASDRNLCPKAEFKGTVDYESEMPLVFNRSKINLNISLRSIQSGIPLRCMDIMGSQGFLISNYQPELAELFIPGEEFIYYEDEYDLLNKVDYYLQHDEERSMIAENGFRKVDENFSYEVQLKRILEKIKA